MIYRTDRRICHRTPGGCRTYLRIHDVSGRLVRTLFQESLPPGVHHVRWDGRDRAGRLISSGVYSVRLEYWRHQRTSKLGVWR